MTAETPVEPELPRGVALAWGVAASPQRGPKREMSIERIVDAAVEIADAEGLAAVSMSRVAQSLGYTTMSLYRYVTAKDDLLVLMQEQGIGLPPEPDPALDPSDWRGRLRAIGHAQLEVHRRHPWLLDIPIQGTPVTPNNLAWMDAMLEALSSTPLDQGERVAVILLVTGQLQWQSTIERSYEVAAHAAGIETQAIDDGRSAMLAAFVTAEEFPALRRAVDAGVFADGDDPFAFGLERVFDGVAVHMAERAAGAPADASATPREAPEVTADKRVREARKAVREAEKRLRDARKVERQARREAVERHRRDDR
ncbi:TetR/AcrR family transcriptional regulator [Agromyces aurantiacus]|uniref:TetR/AcrR family transcriptional regulator n=1 Tax=Agromyces aurantiacus TaxID=165814 RepID=A0ABV9R734_9MICO|nr:TetR/AcrR family transcriptional regulator [Agromyces aurantiacus]MBM7504284.1 AcrR family transcriptional regulator [Agromyces aurantiacus]